MGVLTRLQNSVISLSSLKIMPIAISILMASNKIPINFFTFLYYPILFRMNDDDDDDDGDQPTNNHNSNKKE